MATEDDPPSGHTLRLAADPAIAATAVRSNDFMEVYALRLAVGNLALRNVVRLRPDLGEVETTLARVYNAVERREVAGAYASDLDFLDALVRSGGLERTSEIFLQTTSQLRSYGAAVEVDGLPRLETMLSEDVRLATLARDGGAEDLLLAWHYKLEGGLRADIHRLGVEFDALAWMEVFGR